jgi:hypothetical protein
MFCIIEKTFDFLFALILEQVFATFIIAKTKSHFIQNEKYIIDQKTIQNEM